MQTTYVTSKKWKKVGASGNTEYLNGIEYKNEILGDLGNNRLTFCDFNNNGRIEISDDPGTLENELEIMYYALSRYRGSLRQMSSGHLILIFQDFARSSIWARTKWKLVCNGGSG